MIDEIASTKGSRKRPKGSQATGRNDSRHRTGPPIHMRLPRAVPDGRTCVRHRAPHTDSNERPQQKWPGRRLPACGLPAGRRFLSPRASRPHERSVLYRGSMPISSSGISRKSVSMCMTKLQVLAIAPHIMIHQFSAFLYSQGLDALFYVVGWQTK